MGNIEEVTIVRIARNKKTGQKGPYTSVGIQTAEYPDKWINGYGNDWNATWVEGDSVKLVIDEVEKNGNKYLNFTNIKKEDAAIERVDKIEKLLLDHLDWHKKNDVPDIED